MKKARPSDPLCIRVAVTYRVLQHWRVPVFELLEDTPGLDLIVLHGQSVPDTKLVNVNASRTRLCHKTHWTVKRRGSPWVFHPFIGWSLVKYSPDVILAEGGSNFISNMIVFGYALIWRRPVIWWTLGELSVERRSSALRKLYRRCVLLQERLASVYLGYSTVAIDYFRRMGYAAERCFRAVNVVDTNRIMSNVDADRRKGLVVKSERGWKGMRLVLFVGALTREKKIERLLRAYSRLSSRGDKAQHLVIVGDGPHASELKAIAKAVLMPEDYTFTGQVVEDVGAYFEIASIFVLPGLGGLAISEAMAHGLPVICTQGDGCEVDLVLNGMTGFRTSADTDDEVEKFITEKIEFLLDHDDDRARMGATAKRLIEEEYNIGTYVACINDAIQCAIRT